MSHDYLNTYSVTYLKPEFIIKADDIDYLCVAYDCVIIVFDKHCVSVSLAMTLMVMWIV